MSLCLPVCLSLLLKALHGLPLPFTTPVLWELYSVKWQFLEHNTVLQTMDPITEVATDDDLAGVYSPGVTHIPGRTKLGGTGGHTTQNSSELLQFMNCLFLKHST